MSERRSKYAGLRDASVSTEARSSVLTDGSEEAGKEARQEASTPVSEAVSEEASAQDSNQGPNDLREAVREALQVKNKQYAGGVKLTLEVTPDLNKRAKRYLLDKSNGATVRALLTELLLGFLSGEEY